MIWAYCEFVSIRSSLGVSSHTLAHGSKKIHAYVIDPLNQKKLDFGELPRLVKRRPW